MPTRFRRSLGISIHTASPELQSVRRRPLLLGSTQWVDTQVATTKPTHRHVLPWYYRSNADGNQESGPAFLLLKEAWANEARNVDTFHYRGQER
jgi:hypothetical protein